MIIFSYPVLSFSMVNDMEHLVKGITLMDLIYRISISLTLHPDKLLFQHFTLLFLNPLLHSDSRIP